MRKSFTTKQERATYQCWLDMKNRCFNTNSQRYYTHGKRGITVCDEWAELVGISWDAMRKRIRKTTENDRIDYPKLERIESMSFIKYQHLERYGNTEVEGIEVGTCYVFPKLDGTNGSVWYEAGTLRCGSRNRELSPDNDNAGFMNAMINNVSVLTYIMANNEHVLYGEWLVPHTLKTYNDDAWRKFYVFDVYDRNKERLLSYDEYSEGLVAAGINVIAPIAIIKNGTEAHFTECLSKAHYLVKDGEGAGEGVVIKNYDYHNKYGRQTWAKIVGNEFKAKHHLEMGAPVIGCEIVEEKIVAKYVTQALVDKVVAKITNEMEGWSSKYIPRLIHTVYYDLVTEETWNFVKEFKNPKVDFKVLSHYTTAKIKQIKPELF